VVEFDKRNSGAVAARRGRGQKGPLGCLANRLVASGDPRCYTDLVAELAVVIVAHDSARWLEDCIASVYAHAGDLEPEVIVVDTESTDGSADLVERLFPAVRVIRSENRGFAAANNRAARETDASFVLFLNPDTEIVQGRLGDLVEELAVRPRVGLVGCRQLDATGAVYPTIRRFPTAVRLFFEAVGSERFPFRASWLGERELDQSRYEQETECDWTSGSFMLVRREALLGAGLMDERFFLYCEEPDLCLRIRRGGWDVRHVPTMTIVHYVGNAGLNEQLVAQDAFARRQYFEKHFSLVHRAAAIGAFASGHVLRAVVGGFDSETRPRRRTCSRAALRALLGRTPPFMAPPESAVSAPEPRQTRMRPIPNQPPAVSSTSSSLG
jgi:N-acetylglucosaminyl-diphospho-decaprenol L-rhamnosyltransferase